MAGLTNAEMGRRLDVAPEAVADVIERIGLWLFHARGAGCCSYGGAWSAVSAEATAAGWVR